LALLARRLSAFAESTQADDAVFASLTFQGSADAAALGAAIGRWRLMDALHAQDLADILLDQRSEEDACRTDRVAYMLRCFFEGCRRTFPLRQTTILLLGRSRLTQGATVSVYAGLARA
jgi:hypothetical protein